MTEYRLAMKWTQYYRSWIAVVGCGGTGGFVAEGLCRLLTSYRQLRLCLIDGDRVEPRNLGRQNFYPEELGQFKSQALAERLARKYQVSVGHHTAHLTGAGGSGTPLERCGLVVGCVDNAPARATIANLVGVNQWWIDAGNGHEHGQVLVGNASFDQIRERWSFEPDKGICHALPLPTLVRPELLVPTPRHRLSCAEAVAAGDQGPTINQFMAALVVEAIRRLLEGRPTWWQVYLDLEAGSLHTVSPSPEAIARLTKIPLKRLVSEPKLEERR